jgi:CRISPR/Cas system-associated protein Cas10 (large subunit of type III CRISPR-Cas system)
MRRILHEEELANLSEDSKKLEAGEARKSERQLKSEIEKHKQALEEYAQEEDWIFDCSVCGVNGENLVSTVTAHVSCCSQV